MDRDEKYYLDKLYICNFKPFEYIDSPDKPYYEIDFNNGNDKQMSMILTGPNGYGKSTIFQAIEFAMMGNLEPSNYKDKARKIEEHVLINNLERACFVALQLRDKKKGYITIVRYTQKGEVGKSAEVQKAAEDFKTYILEKPFVYKEFQPDSLIPVTKNDISEKLGEKNIQEWLGRNYIKQESEAALINKKDTDRVSFIGNFIEQGTSRYFDRFQDELDATKQKCDMLRQNIKELAGKVKEEIEAIEGEEPVCKKVLEESPFEWDKDKYQKEEPFEQYVHKAENTLVYTRNIAIYKEHYCAELLSQVKKREAYYQGYLLSLFKPNVVTAYKNSFQKKDYLLRMIENDNSFFEAELNRTYLTEELAGRLENIREKKKSFLGLLDEKQAIYKRFEELHQAIHGEESIVEEVFENKCPLCGTSFQNTEVTLENAISETAQAIQDMKGLLSTSLGEIEKDIIAEQVEIKAMIEIQINAEQSNKEIYEAIQNMEKSVDEIGLLRRDFTELVNVRKELQTTEYKCFVDGEAFNVKYQKIDDLPKIAEELKKIIDNVGVNTASSEDMFDGQVYLENRKYTVVLQKDSEVLVQKLEQKIKQLKWRAADQKAEEYLKNKKLYDENISKYKAECTKVLKLQKIVKCRDDAEKEYMDKVVKYLEIPLYIYSGKLMQTSKNKLGITCYTGDQEGKLTQVKITDGQDDGKKKLDITEKFSAGQKAVANIALILALKKIASAKLDIFMIDDPCQSLDELNIASFVEIMKNEFSDTQLILSTHEDKIGGYIQYKMQKSNKKIRMFNVQKELYS